MIAVCLSLSALSIWVESAATEDDSERAAADKFERLAIGCHTYEGRADAARKAGTPALHDYYVAKGYAYCLAVCDLNDKDPKAASTVTGRQLIQKCQWVRAQFKRNITDENMRGMIDTDRLEVEGDEEH